MYRETHRNGCRNRICELPLPILIGGEQPDLYVSMIGRSVASIGFSSEWLECVHVLGVVKGGGARMSFDGRGYDLEPGDLYCQYPGHHLTMRTPPRKSWTFSWFILYGQKVDVLLESAGLTKDQPVLQGVYDTLLDPLFSEVELAFRHNVHDPYYPILTGWRLISLLQGLRQREQGEVDERDAAALARAIIDKHHQETDLSVAEISRRLGISRTTLFRRFNEVYQQSPSDYLREARLTSACRWLRETNASIKHVADNCGYETAQYFNRAFKARFGTTPKQWRDQLSGKA